MSAYNNSASNNNNNGFLFVIVFRHKNVSPRISILCKRAHAGKLAEERGKWRGGEDEEMESKRS